jgi:hypothetical protein
MSSPWSPPVEKTIGTVVPAFFTFSVGPEATLPK